MRSLLATAPRSRGIPTVASADVPVSFEVVDHGDAVEVIAHDVDR